LPRPARTPAPRSFGARGRGDRRMDRLSPHPHALVAGVDEAGRGPLAGPVVVAAVVFPAGRTPVNGLDDSKQLDAARREQLYPRIVERALAWEVVFVDVEEIDRINIYHATMAGMRRALESELGALAKALGDGAALEARIDGNRLPSA